MIGWMGALFIVGCSATVTAQLVGLVALSSQGVLTQEKLVRYAGVLYGLDPLDLSPGKNPPTHSAAAGASPEDALADRVQKSPQITARQEVIRKGTDDIRSVVLGLRLKRERQAVARKNFESYLQQLEVENTVTALREIQVTLESLPANQAKDIISFMLTDSQADAEDDAMADVVTLIKAMPAEKLRKIYSEFNTNDERELLHRILVEIGNLDERNTQLTGTQP